MKDLDTKMDKQIKLLRNWCRKIKYCSCSKTSHGWHMCLPTIYERE